METKAVLETLANVLGKNARYASTHAVCSMIAVDFGNQLRNILSNEEVNEFFAMYDQAKLREKL